MILTPPKKKKKRKKKKKERTNKTQKTKNKERTHAQYSFSLCGISRHHGDGWPGTGLVAWDVPCRHWTKLLSLQSKSLFLPTPSKGWALR